MRRLSVDKGWLSENLEPARSRTLAPERTVEFRVFVHGGRWLLSALTGGEIVVTDLDDNDAPLHTLISPREDFEQGSFQKMFHSNYSQERSLEFDLALLHRRRCMFPHGMLLPSLNSDLRFQGLETMVSPAKDCAFGGSLSPTTIVVLLPVKSTRSGRMAHIGPLLFKGCISRITSLHELTAMVGVVLHSRRCWIGGNLHPILTIKPYFEWNV